jgi:Ran GTPase-activating protein (RanGAP) involved in mRNA processing and transport
MLSINQFNNKDLCDICDALKVNTSLQTLKMSHIQQSGEDVSFPNSDGHFFGTLVAQHLSSMLAINKSLTELYVAGNNLRNEGASKFASGLAKNSTLTMLDLSRNRIGSSGMGSLADSLRENKSLLELYLANNSIGDDGMKKLSKILENNIALRILDLTNNGIGVIGQIYLSHALEINTNLTNLNLYDNRGFFDVGTSNEMGSGMKFAESLILSLTANKTLRILDIGAMESDIWPQVSRGLMMNQSLTTLHTKYCELGVDIKMMELLCESLNANTFLTSLNLSCNSLGNSSFQILFGMLRSNKTIAILDLSENSIDDDTTKFIATCLEGNSSLTELNLSANSIGNEGLVYISRSLEVNKGLTKLDLGRNAFGKEGIRELANALVRNTSLRSLSIGEQLHSEYSGEYLNAALLYNKTLTDLQIGLQTGGTTESGVFLHDIQAVSDISITMAILLEQNREFRPNELRSRFTSKVRLNFIDLQLIFK